MIRSFALRAFSRGHLELGEGTSEAGTYIYNYDLDGNLAEVVDPRGFSATYSHDHMDRLLDITVPDGTKVAWTMDADSNVLETEAVDSQGVVVERTSWTYDPYGLTTARSLHHLDGAGSTTQTDTWSFTHGPGLSLKVSTNPLGNTTTLTRDALGRIIKVEDPIQDRVELSYDAAGNLIEEDSG